MSLCLFYITNLPEVALIAEKYGVDRIMIDLETLGKDERQKNMNTVKSHHTVEDVAAVSRVLHTAEAMVRINPWHDGSEKEIDAVIAAGADRIMLPMWKHEHEVDGFLRAVNRRVKTTLLLETKEAVGILDQVLQHSMLDEIHIGLNDLHISYGLTFMFELLTNGIVEEICEKCRKRGISYGFGGIARIGEGTLPAERIVMEHYRLGSTRTILSRSFCNVAELDSTEQIERIFSDNMVHLRDYEKTMSLKSCMEFEDNQEKVKYCVAEIVGKIKESRRA